MNRKQLRHDLNFLTSAGIFVVLVVAAVTGIIAHVWDLNDFIYHVYAGYVLVFFSIAHVAFNWNKLVNYFRWRLGKRGTRHAKITQPAGSKQRDSFIPAPGVPAAAHATTGSASTTPVRRPLVSRRGLIGMTLAALGGVFVGRKVEAQTEIPYGSDLGVVYHEWSKPGTPSIWGTIADWGGQPARYKEYPAVPYIGLPEPPQMRGLHTEDAIQQRRSARTYSGQPMTLAELSHLLSNTGGENFRRWGHHKRTAPSSGALYPIETYLIVHNVEGLEPGIYHYGVEHHGLHQIRTGDFRSDIVRQGVSQGFLGTCNLVVVFTSVFQRMRWKYQQRSYRYGLLEAGHLGQNLCLTATSMGLGTRCVGAYFDRDLDAMLNIDGTYEASLYLIAAGKV